MPKFPRLLESRLRDLDQEKLVLGSGYFDADWYARAYPDVGGATRAVTHFLRIGGKNGYDPGPNFSTSAYLAANPDVREAGYNALVHFLRFGRSEGRGVQRPGTDVQPLGAEALAQIGAVFDAEFYRATNPDLPENGAGLDHFMGQGWREGRDPCPWFSVEHYLSMHRDVAEAGLNPFIHYVLWGCGEGRHIEKSQRRKHARAAATPGRHRLSVLSMVRNEADIIRAFAGHLLALFDEIVFVDHMSTDGTAEFLKSLADRNRRVRVLTLEEPSYIQSVTMTHMVRDCADLRDADWVFLLDADEFLPFSTRADLEQALGRFGDCPVIAMQWQNLIPDHYDAGAFQIDRASEFLAPPELSPFRKVAFQPARLNLDRMVVAQGNHALLEAANGLDMPAFHADFPVLHVPVRSADQLVLKLNQGVEAYRRLGRSRDAAEGTHWDQMMTAAAGGAITPDLMNAVAVRYSESKPSLEPIDGKGLMALGFETTRFQLAHADTGIEPLPERPLGEMLMQIYAPSAGDDGVEDCVATTRLETVGLVLRRLPADRGFDYRALPEDLPEPDGASVEAALAGLLSASYRDLVDLVPSQKAEHLPLLMAVVDLVKPRRLVEIGTLRGAGFLAMCQSVWAGQFACDAVAVSGWDEGQGEQSHAESAFETFKFLIRKYSDFAAFLRRTPRAAAGRFEDGSVDLLMVDGHCDATELRRSLEAWLPKLSARGVLLLHDVNSSDSRFSLWRVWEELGAKYPSFLFPHSEGLGVVCVGDHVPGALPALLQAAANDRHIRSLLRQHFASMGRLSSELFSRRYDMAQAELRAGREGALTEELSWLRQEVDSLRTDNAALRSLVNKEVAHVAAE